MARLRQYTADLTPSPFPTGQRAQPGGAGAALTEFGREGFDAAQRIIAEDERQDALAAYAELAQTREVALRKLDELRGHGKPVAEDFQLFLDAELDRVRQARTSRNGIRLVAQHGANIRSDLGHTARMADVALAGQMAKENAQAVINANGTALQRDPSLLPRVLEEQREYVDALPSSVAPADRQRILRMLNEEAAKNAVRGWIEVDPRLAQERIEKGEWDALLDPDAKATLAGQARQKISRDEQDERIRRAEEKAAKSEAQEELMGQLIPRVHNGKLGTREVDELSRTGQITASSAHMLRNFIEQRTRDRATRTDPKTLHAIMEKWHAGTLTLADVNKVADKLSEADYKLFGFRVMEGTTELRQARSNALREVDRAVFMIHSGFPPDEGQSQARRNMAALVREREDEYRAAGKNPIDYYTSGQYLREANLIAPWKVAIRGTPEEMRQQARELREWAARGAVVRMPSGEILAYSGVGDPANAANWRPADALERAQLRHRESAGEFAEDVMARQDAKIRAQEEERAERRGRRAARPSTPSEPRSADDVLPHERGRIAEAEATGSEPPLLSGVGKRIRDAIGGGRSATLDQVREALKKERPNAGDMLLLESFKDSPELSAEERRKIAKLLKARQ